MEVQDVVKTIEDLQTNMFAGIVLLLYYLIIYWPRIKDGLGLFSDKKYNLDRVEKNFQLLKLRIEIEQIKKNSDLEPELLEQLEQEMRDRLEKKKSASFTGAQKFLGIPLIIFMTLLTFMELQAIEPETLNTEIDILSGAVFSIIIIIIGFWGIPVLKKQKKGWLRKTSFIAYWTFAFYIISYFLIFIFATNVLDIEQLTESTTGIIFLSSLGCSLLLGFFGRLPFMLHNK